MQARSTDSLRASKVPAVEAFLSLLACCEFQEDGSPTAVVSAQSPLHAWSAAFSPDLWLLCHCRDMLSLSHLYPPSASSSQAWLWEAMATRHPDATRSVCCRFAPDHIVSRPCCSSSFSSGLSKHRHEGTVPAPVPSTGLQSGGPLLQLHSARLNHEHAPDSG